MTKHDGNFGFRVTHLLLQPLSPRRLSGLDSFPPPCFPRMCIPPCRIDRAASEKAVLVGLNPHSAQGFLESRDHVSLMLRARVQHGA